MGLMGVGEESLERGYQDIVSMTGEIRKIGDFIWWESREGNTGERGRINNTRMFEKSTGKHIALCLFNLHVQYISV